MKISSLLTLANCAFLVVALTSCSHLRCKSQAIKDPLLYFYHSTGGPVGIIEGVLVERDGEIRLHASDLNHYCDRLTAEELAVLNRILGDETLIQGMKDMMMDEYEPFNSGYLLFPLEDSQKRIPMGAVPDVVVNFLKVLDELLSRHFHRYDPLSPQAYRQEGPNR